MWTGWLKEWLTLFLKFLSINYSKWITRMVSRSARATWNVKKRQWSRSTLKDGGRRSWGWGSGREVIGIHLPRGQWPSPPRPQGRHHDGAKLWGTEIAREFLRRVIKSSLIARRDWITAVPDLISIWNPKDPPRMKRCITESPFLVSSVVYTPVAVWLF